MDGDGLGRHLSEFLREAVETWEGGKSGWMSVGWVGTQTWEVTQVKARLYWSILTLMNIMEMQDYIQGLQERHILMQNGSTLLVWSVMNWTTTNRNMCVQNTIMSF